MMKDNKSSYIRFKISASDKEIIKQKSKSVGVNMSQYLRKVGTGQKLVNKTDLDTIRQLKYIGHNINQIAHELNTYSDGLIIKEAYIQMEEFKKLIAELIIIIREK